MIKRQLQGSHRTLLAFTESDVSAIPTKDWLSSDPLRFRHGYDDKFLQSTQKKSEKVAILLCFREIFMFVN